MAKEFDVYLNNRLTEGDIVVYSIPYRDYLSVDESLFINGSIDKCILLKMFEANGDTEIGSIVLDTHKTVYDDISDQIRVGASVELSADVSLSESQIKNIIGMTMSIETILGRVRALYEMDDDAIAVYDNMPLEDIDYIVI